MNGSRPRVLFLFPHPAESEVPQILAGEMPRERLYGAMELRDRGWQVDFADGRFSGRANMLRTHAATLGINFIDLGTLRSLSCYDCVVAKDSFSTMLTLAGKLRGVPIIYLDAMFALPRRLHRRVSGRVNLRLADRVLCYSKTQGRLWADSFNLPEERFEALPYCIDLDFYRQQRREAEVESMVLAVGRDMGRDFPTLARALRDTEVTLTLVTLPYLVSEEIRRQPNVRILERIPYDELFELYARAACVAVPLQDGVTYPSGIRAVMESLALGKTTLTTESAVLREYFDDGSGVCYVPPYDADAIREQVLRFAGNHAERTRRERLAAPAMEPFGLPTFVDQFEGVLREVVGGGP